MRNLKRALSLAMAAVMLLGMMVVGTSAKGLSDFSDSAEIDNQDAVAVTSAIGIFDGYEDGEFKPDNVVTRAEMAVIIAKILYGSDVKVDQFRDEQVFTDVADWAEGYVNLCASLGIVAGVGDGKFDPNSTVTTAQAALMLCRALGYFQNDSELGESWVLSATAKASSLGMYGDLELSMNAGLTRDNVAEMVFNTLTKAVTVEYNDTFNMYYTTGTEWTAGVEFDYRQTLGYKKFKLVYMSDNADDFGRPCTVWGTGSLNKDDIDDDGDIKDSYDRISSSDEIISAPNGASYSYTAKVTTKTLYNAIGSSTIKDDDYVWSIYVDGDVLTNSETAAVVDSLIDNRTDDDTEFAKKAGVGELTGNGVLTEVYVDSDSKTIDIIIINTYAAEVLEVDESAGTITLSDLDKGPAETTDEFDSTAFEEDDIVLYTYADGDIQTVVKAEEMSGEVTRVRANTTDSEGDNFVVDGVTYKYSYTMSKSDRLVTESVDNDVVAYLDAYGYVIYIDESAVTYDYAYVLSMGTDSDIYGKEADKSDTVYARLLLTDGTIVKVETDEKNATDLLNYIVSYSVDKDDVYSLTKKSNGKIAAATGNDLEIENGKASITVNGTKYTANSNTVFIVVDTDDKYADYDISVYTGIKNVPDIDGYSSGTKAVVAMDKGSSNVAKVVYIEDGDVSGAENVIFARADSGAKLVKDSEVGNYYEINAVVDGETVTLKVKESATNAVNYLIKNRSGKEVVALKSITTNDDDLVTSIKYYETSSVDPDTYYYNATGTAKTEKETVGVGLYDNDTEVAANDIKFYAYSDDVVVVRYDYKNSFEISRIGSIKNDSNDGVVAVLDEGVLIGICVLEEDGHENDNVEVEQSNDTSIESIVVKGVAAAYNTSSKQYEVSVSATANANSEKKIVTKTNDSKATVSYVYNGAEWKNDAGTGSFSASGNVTFTITVTAADGTTEDYTLVVTVAAAKVDPAVSTTNSNITVNPDDKTVTLPKGAEQDVTVDDLLAELKAADADSVKVLKKGSLGNTEAAGSDMVADGMILELTGETTVQYTIKIAES